MEVTCSHFRGEGKGPLPKIAFGATANEGREPLIGLPPHWKSSGRLCLRRRYLLGVGVGDGTVCTGSWESESWFGRSAGRSAVDPLLPPFLSLSNDATSPLCRLSLHRSGLALLRSAARFARPSPA